MECVCFGLRSACVFVCVCVELCGVCVCGYRGIGQEGVAMVGNGTGWARWPMHSLSDETEDGDGEVHEMGTLELLAKRFAVFVLHDVVSHCQVVGLWHSPGYLLVRPCLPARKEFVDGERQHCRLQGFHLFSWSAGHPAHRVLLFALAGLLVHHRSPFKLT